MVSSVFSHGQIDLKKVERLKGDELDRFVMEWIQYLPQSIPPSTRKLRERVEFFQKLCTDAIQTRQEDWLEKKNVQEFCKFFPDAETSECLEKLKSLVFCSIDMFYSFPEKYGFNRSYLREKKTETSFFELIRKNREIPVTDYARFFTKQIALITKQGQEAPELLSMAKVVELWIKQGGVPNERLKTFVNNHPWKNLCHVDFSGPQNAEGTLSDFLCEQVAQEYEKLLGFPLEEQMRKEMLERVKNEFVRKDLLFTLGIPNQLFEAKTKGNETAERYLAAARLILRLKERYTWDEEQNGTLFAWSLFSENSGPCLEKITQSDCENPKPKISKPIALFSVLKGKVVEEETFLKYALEILLFFRRKCSEAMMVHFEKVFSELSWNYFEFSPEHFFAFFEGSTSILQISIETGKYIEEQLQDLGAQGKSPLFLDALFFKEATLQKILISPREFGISHPKVEEIFHACLYDDVNSKYVREFEAEYLILEGKDKWRFLCQNHPKLIADPKKMRLKLDNLKLELSPYAKLEALAFLGDVQDAQFKEKQKFLESIEKFTGSRVNIEACFGIFSSQVDQMLFLPKFYELQKLREEFKKNPSLLEIVGERDKILDISKNAPPFLREPILSGVVYRDPTFLEETAKRGVHLHPTSTFYPLGKSLTNDRMVCSGFSKQGDRLLLDIALVDTQTFFSAGTRAKLPKGLTESADTLVYLCKLVEKELLLIERVPQTPRAPRGIGVDVGKLYDWAQLVASKMQKALWNLSKKAISIEDAREEGGFATQVLSDQSVFYYCPHSSNTVQGGERMEKVEEEIEDGKRWTMKHQNQQLTIEYPNWMVERQGLVANWQRAWLMAQASFPND